MRQLKNLLDFGRWTVLMCSLSSADRFHTFPPCSFFLITFPRSPQQIICVPFVREMSRRGCFLPSLTDCSLMLGAGVDEHAKDFGIN